MYRLTLTLTNPMTGDNEVMTYQFDPATLDQAKWNTGFPAVDARLAALKARAGGQNGTKEPDIW